ncbi:MAG: symbB, partial [Chloroflexi bacterium]|nr:symbB [Chloroflexota bacterium]
WTRRTPAGDGPQARGAHRSVWDSSAQRLLIVSGFGVGQANDLWSYHPAANIWSKPLPEQPRPSARSGHTAVWDGADAQMLVFGGQPDGKAFLGDLWAYRPALRSWLPLNEGALGPTARSDHSAIWDGRRNRMLVFGGYGPEGYFNDLWAYRPDSGWARLATAGLAPDGREGHSAVWDADGDQMLVYGGARYGRTLDDLWAYRPASDTWTELDAEGSWPVGRFRHGAAWDPLGRRMLVFGGYGGGFPGGYRDDLWAFDSAGAAWTRLPNAEVGPSARARPAVAWDASAQRMLISGGYAGGVDYLRDLWAYDSSAGAWTGLGGQSAAPSARSAHSLVWDDARRRLLLFGGSAGSTYGELWSYSP